VTLKQYFYFKNLLPEPKKKWFPESKKGQSRDINVQKKKKKEKHMIVNM